MDDDKSVSFRNGLKVEKIKKTKKIQGLEQYIPQINYKQHKSFQNKEGNSSFFSYNGSGQQHEKRSSVKTDINEEFEKNRAKSMHSKHYRQLIEEEYEK